MPEDIAGTENFTGGAIEKPSDKDVGNDVFQTLETFMERIANHQHTGQDSKEISVNFQKNEQTLVEGVDYSWNGLGNGEFDFQVTLPGPVNENNLRRFFYKSPTVTDYTEFYPEQNRVDATNYRLVANDSTIDDIKVVYF